MKPNIETTYNPHACQSSIWISCTVIHLTTKQLTNVHNILDIKCILAAKFLLFSHPLSSFLWSLVKLNIEDERNRVLSSVFKRTKNLFCFRRWICRRETMRVTFQTLARHCWNCIKLLKSVFKLAWSALQR